LLASRDVQRHRTSKKELDDIRALIARDLADAGVTAVSADRRFATAYNAALLTAHMVIACAGYRVTAKTGHHKVAFDAIRLSANASKYADYFERCRRKRNVIDYTRSQVATETEARENSREGNRVSRIRRGIDRCELLESSALMYQSSPAMPQPLTSSRDSDAGSTALIESRSPARCPR
jgi:hypothetical protein